LAAVVLPNPRLAQHRVEMVEQHLSLLLQEVQSQLLLGEVVAHRSTVEAWELLQILDLTVAVAVHSYLLLLPTGQVAWAAIVAVPVMQAMCLKTISLVAAVEVQVEAE
jgi:hypothetical protein